MNLPIDARHAPFLEKYLDETPAFAPWFVFGYSARDTEDVASADGDIVICCTPEQAARLVELRDAFIKGVHELFSSK